ncbi:MAG: c-type cytochrome domain-containing protein, partial [Acidobacteriota bacterium]
MIRRAVSIGLGLLFIIVAALVFVAQVAVPAAQTKIDFAKDVQPILEEACLPCHGSRLRLSRLDLRTRETAMAGGANGPALVPGDASASRLYRRIAGLEAPAMPMERDPLSAAAIAT